MSKRSVPDEDIKIQSRTWLLEKNQQLERELAGLRKQEKRMRMPFVCCEDQTEQVYRGHASTMLWEFLMESMVKALVESHPAVWEPKEVCQCRMQAMDFVLLP
uniref:Uncharacterized protein n=1 Tax=Cacopsylla melanoneura TaxID=428564 RepID=A0A8D8RF03_9HEMI